MVGTPERETERAERETERAERETERAGSLSRPLHNFDLPSRLRWGHQKQFRCSRSTQSSTSRNSPVLSANVRSHQSRSPIVVSGQPLTTTVTSIPVGPHRVDEEKISIDSSISDGGTEDLESVRQKVVSDLQVAVEEMKLDFTEDKGKGKVEEKKPVEDSLPWNLRNRGRPVYETGGLRRNDRGYRNLLASANQEGSEESSRFSLGLSKSEIETDFLLMTGEKPPRRPKKRPKPVQKKIDGLFPGGWLSEVSADRYKVREVPEPKEK